MTKEEAIIQLQGWKYLFQDCIPEEKGEALDIAIKALKERPNGKWVPCSERLPDKNGYYLTSEENGGIEVEWYDETGWGYFGVLAWMPLPKPWKGETDEKVRSN